MHTPRTDTRILRGSRAAFTLVELLVVIGIIALLVSILLPALNAANIASRSVKCQSNLRQIGVALQQYMLRYGGRLPHTYVTKQTYSAGPVNGSGLDVYWFQRLMIEGLLPGVDDPSKSVTVCPADEHPFRPFRMGNEMNLFRSSYGINNFLTIHDGAAWSAGGANLDGKDDISPVSFGVRSVEYPRANVGRVPAQKIVVAETDATVNEDRGYIVNPWLPNTAFVDTPSNPDHPFDWRRHANRRNKLGTSNVLWLDGHVTPVAQGRDTANRMNPVCGIGGALGTNVIATGKRQWLADSR